MLSPRDSRVPVTTVVSKVIRVKSAGARRAAKCPLTLEKIQTRGLVSRNQDI